MKEITHEEKQTAWKVLDALQNEIPTNQILSTKKVFERFDLIQELKDLIDVRATKEKLSAKSILPYMEGEEKAERESMQQFKNRLCGLFNINEQYLANPIKGSL